MSHENFYDCAIIGGGLGGLSLAITLAKENYKVVLFEKEKYPFHKVCGEYISMESWDYLTQLGLPLKDMHLPMINKLIVSAPDGNELRHDLLPGGFGISRYKIDYALKEIAVGCGVKIMEQCKVEDVVFNAGVFQIKTSPDLFTSKTCCGSFGKRSNLDVKWKRDFIKQAQGKINNFIAVKYHVKFNAAADTISLHNFKDGYCGISKIEDDKYCLCYLTNAANLKNSNNSIEEMEKNILSKNPHLENIFMLATRVYTSPLSISQISFSEKTAVKNHILLVGDAAGLITPLCGNGMSMAMHAARMAACHVSDFLMGKTDLSQMETAYAREWKKTFGQRLKTGRIIQGFFGKPWLTNIFIRTMKLFPFMSSYLIKKTHGRKF